MPILPSIQAAGAAASGRRARAAARRSSRSRRRASATPSRGRGRGSGTGRSRRMRPGLAAQHDHAVGEEQRLVEIVGDQEHGRAGRAAHEAEQLLLQRLPGQRVERAERLVQQQHGRAGDQGAGEGRALRHAAGQRLRAGHRRSRRGRPARASPAASRSRSARGQVARQAERDIVRTAEPGHQPRLLEHHADLGRRAR